MSEPYRSLVSFWYHRSVNLDRLLPRWTVDGQAPQVFADSGAYSAMTKGQRIDVGEYADWLHATARHFTVYASLDVIGDYRGSMRNLHDLENRGLRPLPVWHAGEPLEVLRELCEQYRYVAIGGIVNRTLGPMLAHTVRWFQIAREHGTALHGFGMTQWDMIATFPWYSVDSSAAGSGYRYGMVRMFDPDHGKWCTVPLYSRTAWGRYGHLVRRWGFDPEDFIDRERYRRVHAVVLAALSWREAEEYLRARFGPVTMSKQQHPPHVGITTPGLHLYCADQSGTNETDSARAMSLGRFDRVAFAHRLGPVNHAKRRNMAKRKGAV